MKVAVLGVFGFVSSLAAYFYLGYGVERSDFAILMTVCAALFAMYFLALHFRDQLNLRYLIFAAIVFRAVFLLSEPRLSDDHFRFLWDGSLTLAGENPYLSVPETLVYEGDVEVFGLNGRMYEGMNSKSYYTVYPPVNQAFFAAAVALGEGDFDRSVFALHVLLLLFELIFLLIATLLIARLKKPAWWILIYALNPLVIIELSGNLHFEGVVLAFLALAAFAIVHKGGVTDSNKRLGLAGIALGFAISVKLTPLMVLPLILLALYKFRSMIIVAIATGATIVFTFLPYLSSELLLHFQSSIGLYFTRFEFNASVYYLLREMGFAWLGYNPIGIVGPLLGMLTLLVLGSIALVVAIRRRRKTLTTEMFINAFLLSYTVFFLFATTVHPWYITTLVGLLVFASRKQLVFWSFLVLLSYSHYAGGRFEENMLVIALEYSLLVAVLWLQFGAIFSNISQPKNI